MPFVLHSQPTAVFEGDGNVTTMANIARRRYAEIMEDVEGLINDHSTILLGFRTVSGWLTTQFGISKRAKEIGRSSSF